MCLGHTVQALGHFKKILEGNESMNEIISYAFSRAAPGLLIISQLCVILQAFLTYPLMTASLYV